MSHFEIHHFTLLSYGITWLAETAQLKYIS